MALTKTAYRNYLFEKIDDGERLAVEHRLYKPNFVQRFQQVLNDYGLADQIKAAQAGSRPQVKILDVGCGEGLYLHDVAAELETQGLLEGTILYGFDNNATAMETATQFSKVSNPPRPYINYYWQDLTQPLDKSLFGESQFDFIYAHIMLAFLPNARQNLTHLYEVLTPGGTIFLRDLILHEGADGWELAHPALHPFVTALTKLIASANNGEDVSLKYADWLREAGASLVQAEIDELFSGGETKPGMDSLRAIVMTLRNTKPMLIATGMMTEAQIDELLVTLYREISAKWVGLTHYMNTLARKPFSNP